MGSHHEYRHWNSYAYAPCPRCGNRLRYGDLMDGSDYHEPRYLGMAVKCKTCNRVWEERDYEDGILPTGVLDSEGRLIGESDDLEYKHDPANGVIFEEYWASRHPEDLAAIKGS